MIFGARSRGSIAVPLEADKTYVSEYRLPRSSVIVKLTAPIDGLGRGTTDQQVRAVMYDTDGILRASSPVVTIGSGQPVRWVDFTLQSPGSPGVALAAGDYLLGLQAGPVSRSARVWAEPGPTNRIVAPSFEYQAIGSTPPMAKTSIGVSLSNITTFQVVSDWARFGGKSVLVSTSISVGQDQAVGVASARIDVEPGTPLAARFSLNLTRGAAVWPRVGVQFYDSGGSRLDYVEDSSVTSALTAPIVTDVFAQLGDVPDDAATAIVSYLVYSGLPSLQRLTFYIDALTFGVLDYRIYLDGDEPGYLWTGVRGNSRSSVGRAFPDSFASPVESGIDEIGGEAFPRLSIFGTAITAYTTPSNVDDEYLMGLPFATAQRVLGSTQPLPGTETLAQCGWHGTLTDPERGSVAVVRTGGPLADLVGERVQISYEERTVVAYIHNELDVLDDISLPRRSFMKLALASAESIAVTVSTLAGEEQT